MVKLRTVPRLQHAAEIFKRSGGDVSPAERKSAQSHERLTSETVRVRLGLLREFEYQVSVLGVDVVRVVPLDVTSLQRSVRESERKSSRQGGTRAGAERRTCQ